MKWSVRTLLYYKDMNREGVYRCDSKDDAIEFIVGAKPVVNYLECVIYHGPKPIAKWKRANHERRNPLRRVWNAVSLESYKA